jgi:hypothetical protein|nr:MAG TPA: hypothetical protein [Podoviridae sp. ctY3D12]
MDFSKYNKWLRYYAAIFDLNPDVFNTEKFIDVTVVNSKSIGIIYSNLYDQYIIQELTYNRFFYNCRIIDYKDTKRYAYVFTLTEEEAILLFDRINSVSNMLLTNDFYMKVCITWKNYLDNSFYECLYM